MKSAILSLALLTSLSASAWSAPWTLRTDALPEVETASMGFLDYLRDGGNPNRNYNSGGNANKVYVCNFGNPASPTATPPTTNYFPYTTPVGRRIGFGLPVPTATEASDFASGITPAQADTRLANAVTGAVNALIANLGNTTWEGLDIYGQEMLVDFTISECLTEAGTFDMAKLPATFKATVLAYPTLATLKPQLVANMSYVRKTGALVNVLKNRAFAFRFLGGGGIYHH